ncbi:MAG TPA: hypothetical protein EYH22_00460, partial [Candidatus Nanopusillus sp.]|nr:hypothetical protein [Candidatus Nanopusillus sp.]
TGDSMSVGAGLTGEITLYGSLVMVMFLLSRVFSEVLLAIVGISIIGIIISTMPLIFKFKEENSNHMNIQLFWISLFMGVLSAALYLAK